MRNAAGEDFMSLNTFTRDGISYLFLGHSLTDTCAKGVCVCVMLGRLKSRCVARWPPSVFWMDGPWRHL